MTADWIIIRRGLLAKYKPETRLSVIFIILNIPLLWLLMQLDYSFHPLQNLFYLNDRTLIGLAVKVLLAVIIMLLMATSIYLLLKTMAQKKNNTQQKPT